MHGSPTCWTNPLAGVYVHIYDIVDVPVAS